MMANAAVALAVLLIWSCGFAEAAWWSDMVSKAVEMGNAATSTAAEAAKKAAEIAGTVASTATQAANKVAATAKKAANVVAFESQIHQAARDGNVDLLRSLMGELESEEDRAALAGQKTTQLSASYVQTRRHSVTPLMLALQHGQHAFVKALLEY